MLLLDLDEQRHDIIYRINNHTELFKSMLTNKSTGPTSKPSMRHHRALFSFIGQISRSLFGTASLGDIKLLANHIQQVEKETNLQNEQIHRHDDMLSSFMKTSGQRVSNALHGMKLNHQDIAALHKQVQALQTTYDKAYEVTEDVLNRVNLFASLLQILMSDLNNLIAVERLSQNFMLASQTILEGYLPIALISPDQVRSVLQQIKVMLPEKYAGFQLAYTDEAFVYQNRDILYTVSDKYLYLAVKIPLRSLETYFEIFNIVTLPVPLNATRTDTTLIHPGAEFIGISRDEQFYIEFDFEFWAACHGKEFKVCDGTKSMKPRSAPSCASALYFDIPRDIMRFCEIQYETDGLLEGAVDLTQDLYLASGKPTVWEVACLDGPTMTRDSCVYCLLKLRCGCSLRSPTFEIAAKITGCTKGGQDLTYLHPMNLAVRYALHPDDKIYIPGRQTYRQIPKMVLPNITLSESEDWESISHKDKKLSMDFKKLIKKAKKNEKLYASTMHNGCVTVQITRYGI
jgi:hypothetical protein